MTAVLRWLSLVATPPRAWREHLLRNVKPSRYCSRTSGNRLPRSYLYICVSVCFLLIPRASSACAASSHPPLSHAVVAALVCSRARATLGIWRCWKSKVRRVIMPSAMISRASVLAPNSHATQPQLCRATAKQGEGATSKFARWMMEVRRCAFIWAGKGFSFCCRVRAAAAAQVQG